MSQVNAFAMIDVRVSTFVPSNLLEHLLTFAAHTPATPVVLCGNARKAKILAKTLQLQP